MNEKCGAVLTWQKRPDWVCDLPEGHDGEHRELINDGADGAWTWTGPR